ncbi:hypothetical protein BaRGS_00036798 [Batillaria attramentaria]|uniref:Uncharacterized protein n=1 Tax=Batillaria attramentaria TaxID=370345 RepID=A0ABD0JAQ7_9CAEN
MRLGELADIDVLKLLHNINRIVWGEGPPRWLKGQTPAKGCKSFWAWVSIDIASSRSVNSMRQFPSRLSDRLGKAVRDSCWIPDGSAGDYLRRLEEPGLRCRLDLHFKYCGMNFLVHLQLLAERHTHGYISHRACVQ